MNGNGNWARRLRCLMMIGLSGGSPLARSESVPIAGALDARIRAVEYDPLQVYRLEGQVGYQIDIQFDRGETFVGLGAGDLQALAFTAQGNHLFLKPKASRVETNVTVITSLRDYRFEYSVGQPPSGSQEQSALYALRFIYPTDKDTQSPPSQGPAANPLEDLRAAATTAPRNTDYWYCGHASLKPTAAWDDGMRTLLRFGVRAELPAIFVVNDDDTESLVNFNSQQGDIIVHRVARRFVLRRGRLTGCVVNASFQGSGARPATGTISPVVERVTTGESK
ncbi:MAG TPA: TrbG/VirB9 family P-type conjugative transfer protein [Steroidobacteraceae bacterium]|jgi:type IV secretion system protein VirB9